jgi:hypothetical protein
LKSECYFVGSVQEDDLVVYKFIIFRVQDIEEIDFADLQAVPVLESVLIEEVDLSVHLVEGQKADLIAEAFDSKGLI